jgi:hypothetical protein
LWFCAHRYLVCSMPWFTAGWFMWMVTFGRTSSWLSLCSLELDWHSWFLQIYDENWHISQVCHMLDWSLLPHF